MTVVEVLKRLDDRGECFGLGPPPYFSDTRHSDEGAPSAGREIRRLRNGQMDEDIVATNDCVVWRVAVEIIQLEIQNRRVETDRLLDVFYRELRADMIESDLLFHLDDLRPDQ